MKKVNGDVRVIGMVAGNHVIEDIGMDVAFRTVVVIPQDQALRSKDLWRSISQGFLCQIPSAPYPTGAVGVPADSDKARLEKYAAELEARVVRLQSENASLRQDLEGSSLTQSAKLDEILKAIQSGLKVVPAPSQQAGGLPSPAEETVDGAAPTFLPAEIRAKDLDARINIQGEESTSDAVSEAADRLRQLRKKDRTP